MPIITANIEMDSHADTCCLWKNFSPIAYTNHSWDVYGFAGADKIKDVPIVSGATVRREHNSAQAFLLIIHQGLYYGDELDHS